MSVGTLIIARMAFTVYASGVLKVQSKVYGT